MDKEIRNAVSGLLLIAAACGGYYFTERQLDKARVADVQNALRPLAAIDNRPTEIQMDEALRAADAASKEADQAMRDAERMLGKQ